MSLPSWLAPLSRKRNSARPGRKGRLPTRHARGWLGLEALENRLVPTTFRVSPTAIVDATHFQTIQDAISAAANNDVIEVASGAYGESDHTLVIDKSLTLQGPNSAISPNGGMRNAEAILTSQGLDDLPSLGTVIEISGSGLTVEIDGFEFDGTSAPVNDYGSSNTVTLSQNLFHNIQTHGMYFETPTLLTLDDNRFSGGDYGGEDTVQMGVNFSPDPAAVSITNNVWTGVTTPGLNLSAPSGTVSGNQFLGNPGYGILVANNAGNLAIVGNTFDGITNPDPLITPTWGAGVRFYDPLITTTVSVTGNTFENSAIGVAFRLGSDITGSPIDIHGNTFTNNTNAFYHDGTGNLDITAGNIFDAVDSTTATQQQLLAIENNIHDGLDEAGKGFIVVQAHTAFVSPGGDIQAAIAAASSGDTIFLGAGTYASPLVLSKDIILAAQGLATLSGGIDLSGHQLTLGSDAAGKLESAAIISDSIGTGQVEISGGFVQLDVGVANTYTGDTTITGGTLAVNGSITSNVDNSGTLQGTGTITGNVSGSGTFKPGNSPGIMNIIGDFTPTGSVEFDVNSAYVTPGTDYDQYIVSGTVDLSGATITFVNTIDLPAPGLSSVLTLISSTSGAATTPSSSLAEGSLVTIGSHHFRVSYVGVDGNDFILIEATTPTVVYVSAAWTPGFYVGQTIADADPVTAGSQSAVFGVTAFATVGGGLSAVAPGGTVYVNSGDYSTEAVTVANGLTVRLLGTAPATPGIVTFGALAGSSGATVDTGTVGALVNVLQEGSLGTSTLFSGLINGPGGLTVQGGVLTLGSANTYGDTTVISAGKIVNDVANALPVGTALTVGGTLDLKGFGQQVASVTGAGAVTNSSATAAIFTVNNSSPDSFAGLLSGKLALTKTNTGVLTLGSANTYTGATTISAGTIADGVTNALPIGTALGVTGTLDLAGFDQQVGSVTGSGTVTNSSGAAATFTVNNAAADLFAGTIGGANLALAKSAGGTLTLTSANNYGGSTTISAGTIANGINNALPAGTALTVNGTLNLAGFDQQVGSVTGSGTVTNSSGTASVFTVNNGAADSFAGLISGNLALKKTNAGTLTLGSANTYSGSTTISAGTVANGINNALPVGTALSVSGTLDLAGFNQQVASVTGSGTVTNSSGTASLFTVNNATANTFIGTMSGNLKLTKNNTGIFTLTNANTYTGLTTINAGGTLAINGSITSNVVSSGTLRGTGTITGNVSGTGIFEPGNSAGILTINGNFTPTGTVRFDVNSAYATAGTDYDQFVISGSVNLSGATVTFVNTSDATAPAINTLLTLISKTSPGATTASANPAQGSVVSIGSRHFFIFYNGGDGNDVVLVEATRPGTVYVSAAWSSGFNPGQKILDADPVTAGAQPAIIGVTGFATVGGGLTAVLPAGTALVNSGDYSNEAVNLTSNDKIKLLGLAPATPGAAIFGSLAGTAGTTIDTGTVGGLANTLEVGSLGIATTYRGVISGPGGLTVVDGTLVLTGTETYTGATTIFGGELQVDGQLGNSPVSVESGGTLGGTGAILGAITVQSAGVVDPGAAGGGVGSLTVKGGVTFQPDSIYNADVGLSPLAVITNDRLIGGANIIVAPGARLQLGTGFAPYNGIALNILHSTTAYGSVFLDDDGTPMTQGGTFTISGGQWKITYVGAPGHDIILTHNSPTDVWTGAGDSNLWSNPDNWSEGVPEAGDALLFPVKALQKFNVNDLGPDFVVGEIDLVGSGYNLSGDPIILDAGIQDSATGINTVALDVTLDNNTIWTKKGSATVTDTGSIETAGFTLYVGTTATTASMNLAGAITGGGSVFKNGVGTLTYSGADSNTYTGLTLVNTGTLNLMKSNPATALSGPLVVGDGVGGLKADVVNILFDDQILDSTPITVNSSGYLNFGPSSNAIGDLTLNGGSVNVSGVSGGIELTGDVTANQSSSISKNVTLSPGMHTFTVASGVTLTLAAQINGVGADLTKAGPGTLTFSGATENLYTGTTLISGGTLNLAKSGGISIPGPLVVGDGSGPATVNYQTANQIRDNQPITVNAGATLKLNGLSDEVGELTLNGGSILMTGAAKLTINGDIAASDTSAILGGKLYIKEVTRAITVEAGGTLTITSAISSIFAAGITKLGAGTLVLGGSSSYTGTTAVSDGVLQLSGGSLASALVLASGSTLAGSGATGTLTFNSGSALTANVAATSGSTVKVTGNVNLGGAALNVVLGALPAINKTFTILTSTTKIVGTFDGLGNNQLFMTGGHLFRINYALKSVTLTFLS